MLPRTPEPELMDDADQAQAYAAEDFSAPNELFVSLFLDRFPDWRPRGWLVDLGCGPADIPLRLKRHHPALRLVGVDGAPAMLAHGRELWAQAGLQADALWVTATLPDLALPVAPGDAVISNSLLHHLHDPSVLWRSLRAVGAPGAPVLVMDLMRPADAAEVQELVQAHAADAPAVLRRDFEASLHAAFTAEEVRGQLAAAGLDDFRVERVSDRHLAAWGRLPDAQAAGP